MKNPIYRDSPRGVRGYLNTPELGQAHWVPDPDAGGRASEKNGSMARLPGEHIEVSRHIEQVATTYDQLVMFINTMTITVNLLVTQPHFELVNSDIF